MEALAAAQSEDMLADLLIARTRAILWVSLFVGLAFTAAELLPPPRLAGPFFVKCIGLSSTTAALLFVRGPWVTRHALPVSFGVLVAAYLLTAISGTVSPSREYETTAVLFVGGALTTSILLPWGLWPQGATVLLATALLCVAAFRADGNLHAVGDDPSLAVAVAFVLSLVIAREMQRYRLISIEELAARRRAELALRALNADLERRVLERTAELQGANAQLHALSARLESVREEERMRIAREIHDELGQMMIALKIDLDMLPRRIAAGRDETGAQVVREKVAAMSALAQTMIESVRRISAELRPSVLDDLGLAAAIAWQARQFEEHYGVRCTFTCAPDESALDQVRSTALFRIVQEALSNVALHAGATSVAVGLRNHAGDVILEVRDDDRGATAAEIHNPESLGLLEMRERARLLGGDVDIRGIPGHGTTVRVRIPRPEAAGFLADV